MVSGNDIRNGRHNHQLINDQACPGISIVQDLFIICYDVFILVNDFQERRKIRHKKGKQSCSNVLRHGLLCLSPLMIPWAGLLNFIHRRTLTTCVLSNDHLTVRNCGKIIFIWPSTIELSQYILKPKIKTSKAIIKLLERQNHSHLIEFKNFSYSS